MRPITIILVGCSIFTFTTLSFADIKNYPCSGAPGAFRVNPDNNPGGFVASSATVDSSIFIDVEASVCERAIVIEGAKVLGRAEISGRATVRGQVIVQDRAKVYGEAYLININGTPLTVKDDSKIYGFGFLQGSVIVGDYSEVFGWGKVLDFAQVLGGSRVCGSGIVGGFEVITVMCNESLSTSPS